MLGLPTHDPALSRFGCNRRAVARAPGPQQKVIDMALRPSGTITSKRSVVIDEPDDEQFSQRRRPDVKQFRLQIDRQTKSSYDALADAQAAGLAIKIAHPIVQVSIYDATAGETHIVEAPEA
jgi:hypothetical protein